MLIFALKTKEKALWGPVESAWKVCTRVHGVAEAVTDVQAREK